MASAVQGSEIRLEKKLEQRQKLSMKQRQSLELLHCSRMELEQYLADIISINPFIETEELPVDDGTKEFSTTDSGPESTEDESLYDELNAENSDEWLDFLPVPETPAGQTDFLLFESAPGPTLEENLKQELELSTLPENVNKELCLYIIEQLDDEGFLRIHPADVAMNCNAGMDDVERAVGFIQSLDPPGVGARNLQECWLLQLERRGELTPEFEQLLTVLADDVERNRLDLVAAKLHISMDELKLMFKKLKRLNRAPVSADSNTVFVTPDVEIIVDKDGEFFAQCPREKKQYKLSGYAEWENAPDAGKDFVEKIRDAKNLLEALEFRKSTLLRIGEMIIDKQRDFLESGPEKLKPFTMKQAAEYLDFKSESTVSRAVAEKYIKTPQGFFPLKYFFSAGYVSEDGAEVSRRADKEKLRELIETEDKCHPFSDEKLSQLLNESGHPVARRTVVKYRELMKIPNSSLRKEHF